jgi:DNA-binding beta-propeller fold protein YncE
MDGELAACLEQPQDGKPAANLLIDILNRRDETREWVDEGRSVVVGQFETDPLPHHVVGTSPDGSEIYMTDRSVFGASLHQQTRTLAFSQDIVSNGFLVSPDGTRLYSHNERLDVAANTPLANLPVDITTGSSWAAAPIPGGPAISPDGGRIFCNNGEERRALRDPRV